MKISGTVFLCLLAVAVVGVAMISGTVYGGRRISGFESVPEKRMEVKGIIESVGRTGKGKPAVTISLCGERFAGERTVVYMSDTAYNANLRPGDTLAAEVRMKRVENFTDEFDYVGYMAGKRVYFICFQKGEWSVAQNDRPEFRYVVSRARGVCVAALRRSLSPLGKENSALLVAFLAGEKEEIGDDLMEDFRRSGMMHTLALSGLHVGIIYSLLAFAFSVLGHYPASRKVRSVIVIGALWPYALLTGMGTSIFRAVVMATVYEVAVILDRERSMVNSLALSAIIVTVADPSAPSSLSFQLSFGAMLGIVLFFRPLSCLVPEKPLHREMTGLEAIMAEERLPERRGVPDGWWLAAYGGKCSKRSGLSGMEALEPFFERWMSLILRLRKRIWDLCALSLSCQMVTAPVVWLVFGTFPKWSLLANVLCAPLVGFSMSVAPLCMVLNRVPYVGGWGFSLLDRILDLLRFFVGVMGSA